MFPPPLEDERRLEMLDPGSELHFPGPGAAVLGVEVPVGVRDRLDAMALLAAAAEMDVRLVEINGGSMRNAIPREAEARVVIDRKEGRRFKQTVDACLKKPQRCA